MKTFAQAAKAIENKYANREDKLSIDSKNREFELLKQQQEELKASMKQEEDAKSAKAVNRFMAKHGGYLQQFSNGGNMYGYGGVMGKNILDKGGYKFPDVNAMDKRYEDILKSQEEANNYNGYMAKPENTTSYQDTPYQDIYSHLSNNFGVQDATSTNDNVVPFRPNNTSIPTNPKGKFDYLSAAGYLGQLAGPASQLYYGLTKKDKINFPNVTANLVSPEMNAIARQTAEEARRTGNSYRSLLKSQNTSQGNYLSNLSNQVANEQQGVGNLIANTGLQARIQDTQILNHTSSQNAQIGMQRDIARQQELDARRSAVTSGLSGIGALGSGMYKDRMASKEMALQSDNNLMFMNGMYGNQYFRDKDGRLKKNPNYVGTTGEKAINWIPGSAAPVK